MAKRKSPGYNLGKSKKVNQKHDNSIPGQCKRILDMLIEKKCASTFYIRNTMN